MFKRKNKLTIVKIAENSFLNLIRQTNKGELHLNDTSHFKKDFEYFKNNDFWNKDLSYKFIERHLNNIISPNMKLLDIGCYVGSLPFFLKKFNFWDKIEYSGTDILPNALNIASDYFPDGHFFHGDAQELNINDFYDIVYSKGTIISTFYPDKALYSILDIPSKYIILAHQPLFNPSLKHQNKFESLLTINNNNTYTSTVLYYDFFVEELEKRNIKIIAKKKRLIPSKVKNFNNYHNYDFLLEKNH